MRRVLGKLVEISGIPVEQHVDGLAGSILALSSGAAQFLIHGANGALWTAQNQ